MYMNYKYTYIRTAINIPLTSLKLRELRISHKLAVKDLQEIFEFQTPMAIYAWENPNIKKLPTLEHLDILARLYGLHVEELYVTNIIEQTETYSFAEEFNPGYFPAEAFSA